MDHQAVGQSEHVWIMMLNLFRWRLPWTQILRAMGMFLIIQTTLVHLGGQTSHPRRWSSVVSMIKKSFGASGSILEKLVPRSGPWPRLTTDGGLAGMHWLAVDWKETIWTRDEQQSANHGWRSEFSHGILWMGLLISCTNHIRLDLRFSYEGFSTPSSQLHAPHCTAV